MKELWRVVLLLAMVAAMAAMTTVGALSVSAQQDTSLGKDDATKPTEPPPFADTTDEPFFEGDNDARKEDTTEPTEPPPFANTTDRPSSGNGSSGQEAPLCAPEWLQEWHELWVPVGDGWWYGWWYFWWYQWCYTSDDGWYQSYDGWDWGPAIGWWGG